MDKIISTKNIGNVKIYFLIFLSFIISMNVWFVWNINIYVLYLIIDFLLIFIVHKSKINIEHNRNNIISTMVLACCMLYSSSLFRIICISPLVYIILSLSIYDKQRCMDYITKCLCYLLIPSIILFLILQFVKLPSLGAISITSHSGASYTACQNYIILVKGDYYGFRFSGPFLEPGHLGMMISFILFANNWNLKDKHNLILFIISLFTLSLAAYILHVIGYILVNYVNKTFKMKSIALFFFILYVLYELIINYNDGHNILNENIIERLDYDEEKGFVGNNRAFGLIPQYYEDMWKGSNTKILLFGYDASTIKWLAEHGSRGVGYVMYMVLYGLVGVVLSSLFYLYYAIKSSNKRYAIIVLIFVAIMFWQRSYPYWISWIICYVFSISLNNYNTENENRNNYIS